MKNGWPMVPLGEVMRRSEDWISLDPQTTYREVTVRLWGKGVKLRRACLGAEIKSNRRLRVRPGQFIASRIDARNGAFGVIPEELDGAVVTNDFPVFIPDRTRLHIPFLDWLSKTNTFIDLCKAASEGTTNRVRLKEDHFLDTSIALPPIEEQRRIVARIEAIAERVDHARLAVRQANKEADQLIAARSHELFNALSNQWSVKTFQDFNAEVTSGPRNWSQYIAEDGLRFYRAQDLTTDFQIDPSSKCFISPPANGQGAAARLCPDDLLIVITGATVGRCARYVPGLEPGFVSQHVATCRFGLPGLDPAFALWALRSPIGQSQLLGQRYGQGKPGLNLGNIRRISLPIPPVPDQRRIVAHLDQVSERVREVRSLQRQSSAELDALLPSILDKAFKGELSRADSRIRIPES